MNAPLVGSALVTARVVNNGDTCADFSGFISPCLVGQVCAAFLWLSALIGMPSQALLLCANVSLKSPPPAMAGWALCFVDPLPGVHKITPVSSYARKGKRKAWDLPIQPPPLNLFDDEPTYPPKGYSRERYDGSRLV